MGRYTARSTDGGNWGRSADERARSVLIGDALLPSKGFVLEDTYTWTTRHGPSAPLTQSERQKLSSITITFIFGYCF